MAKKKMKFSGVLAAIIGVLVALAIAFGMIGGSLTIPFIPLVVMQVAGWIVVISTIVSVLLSFNGK